MAANKTFEGRLSDIYFDVFELEKYPKTQLYVDIGILAFSFLLVIFASVIICKGLKKMKYLEHNKNLIKDKDWKDIHMVIPKSIIILTIASMVLFIIIHTIEIYIGLTFELGLVTYCFNIINFTQFQWVFWMLIACMSYFIQLLQIYELDTI